ncbi:heterokaryon incompatibility protein-domain-containing protein [Paraphoma chrysanthemicola]|nr:heterokaryon incompatibility protein-domain-containing protein [Paraphoma chrysanthemicola]
MTIGNDQSAQLDRLCQRCEPVLRASKIISQRYGDTPEEDLKLHNDLRSLEQSVQAGCHFCTHIRYALTQDPYSALRRVPHPERDRDYAVYLVVARQVRGDPHFRLAAVATNHRGQQIDVSLNVRSRIGMSLKEPPPIEASNEDLTSTPDAASANFFTGSEAHLNLASRWLDDCASYHSECGPIKYTPTRLLSLEAFDQNLVRLVEAATPTTELQASMPYCCLSYRWGEASKMTRLLKSNIDEFKSAIQVDSLPTTFRDAMRVTKRLGIDFLWIDALCIVQNSADDWRAESSRMDAIFEGATCTIAAAGASDSHGGCFKTRKPLELLSCHIPGTSAYVAAMFATLSIDEVTDSSPLSHRGWIFQERLLSCRTLSFGRNGLFWHCARGAAAEQNPAGWGCIKDGTKFLSQAFAPLFGPKALPSLPWIVWPHFLTLSSKTLFQKLLQMEAATWGSVPDIQNLEEFHRYWMSIVDAYTQCALTKQEDKLVALSGLVTRIKSAVFAQTPGAPQSDPYILGLWHISLPLDLLWITNHPAPPSATINGMPSWTWASKNGPVSSLVSQYELFKHSGPVSTWPPAASIEPFRNTGAHTVLVITGALIPIRSTPEGPIYKIKHDEGRAIMTYCFDELGNMFLAFCLLPFFVKQKFCAGLLLTAIDETRWRRIGVAWGRNVCGWMAELPKVTVQIE